jgi:hypothetical protein
MFATHNWEYPAPHDPPPLNLFVEEIFLKHHAKAKKADARLRTDESMHIYVYKCTVTNLSM